MQFRFENPTLLWALLGVLALGLFVAWQRHQQKRPAFHKTTWFGILALALCILGLARPQGGMRVSTPQTGKNRLFIAMDISRSMLAQDTSPSRNLFAIAFAQRLLQTLTEPSVALYSFALSGFLNMPLTSDVSAIADLISSLSPSATTDQGTDINLALQTLWESIEKTRVRGLQRGEEWAPPAVLLLSDGETHVPLDEKTLSPFRAQKIRIYSVGIGTPQGGSIPEETRFGSSLNVIRNQGAPVITRLDAKTLNTISQLTGGEYYPAQMSQVASLTTRLERGLKLSRISTSFKLQKEFYPWVFLVAFILFLCSFSQGRWEYAIRGFLVLLFLGTTTAHAQEETENRALKAYNEGVKAMTKEKLDTAAELFQESALSAPDTHVRKKAWFNLGNTFLRMGDPQQALQAYQQAYDTKTDDDGFNSEANQFISDNMALATKVQKMMQQKSQSQQGNGNPQEGQDGKSQDQKGPKKFQAEPLTEGQKQRVWDLVSNEERQALQRMREKRQTKRPQPTDKPW